MSEIEVRELHENDLTMWDELVERSPHGTIFHTTDWLNICCESLEKELKIYGCFEKDELVAGCSLFEEKEKLFFRVASSTCSVSPYGGVLLAHESNNMGRRQLHKNHDMITNLFETLYKEKYHSVQITNSPEFLDIRPFKWNGWDCNIKYAYYIDLEKDIENNVSKSVKNNVKKARKSGIQTKRKGDINKHYELFKTLFEKQGLKPPVEKVFFERLFEIMISKGIGEMWVSETPESDIATSNIVLWDNKRAYGWSVASDSAFKRSGANVLLDYEIFQSLKVRGFKEINCMSGNFPRLTEYIIGFHPTLMPYYEISKKGYGYRCAKSVSRTCRKINNWIR